MKEQLTNEEYEILTKDLSARAFYGCYVHFPKSEKFGKLENSIQKLDISNLRRICINLQMVVIKPYLRPMSSMTKDEVNQYCKIRTGEDRSKSLGELDAELFDFYHKNHIDYRGLIEMDLAIEAPKEMYE